jgi:hypothetical protein
MDQSSSNTEGFNFFKEERDRHTLIILKSHIKILKTLNQYESSRIETEKLKDMFTSLSKPDPIKGMTGNNHIYSFLTLVSNYICYSKFNCKYLGDKPEEIPLVLDNLFNYINDLFFQSKQRTLDNCKGEENKAAEKDWIGLGEEITMLDDRPI